MNSTMTLAEMANNTNYATMNYAQLAELDFALTWAIGQVKTLIPIKRRDEMEMVTKTYVTVMNGYCATEDEILDCIRKEESAIKMDSKDVDDQEASIVTTDEKMDNGETLPALPESSQPSTAESDAAPSQDENNPEKPQNDETVLPKNKETIIDQAIRDAKARPVKEEIDINKAYFIDHSYDINENGELTHMRSHGHNLDSSEDLEVFKSVGEKYGEYFMKGGVVTKADDYLVFKTRNGVIVRIYHASVENGDGAEPIENSSRSLISDENEKKKAKKRAIMKKAIEKVKKEALEEEDANTPFLYKCALQHGKGFLMINRRLPKEYKDIATLVEMKSIVETYANYYFAYAEVLSNEDGIAVMMGDLIDVIFFNIPLEGNNIERPIKSRLKGRGMKKSVKKEAEKKTGVKPETNEKSVPSIKAKKLDPRCKSIILINKDGEVKEWPSYRICERELGLGFGTVSQLVSGKLKQSKGWRLWKEETVATTA